MQDPLCEAIDLMWIGDLMWNNFAGRTRREGVKPTLKIEGGAPFAFFDLGELEANEREGL